VTLNPSIAAARAWPRLMMCPRHLSPLGGARAAIPNRYCTMFITTWSI
jgi:hypothetical protein